MVQVCFPFSVAWWERIKPPHGETFVQKKRETAMDMFNSFFTAVYCLISFVLCSLANWKERWELSNPSPSPSACISPNQTNAWNTLARGLQLAKWPTQRLFHGHEPWQLSSPLQIQVMDSPKCPKICKSDTNSVQPETKYMYTLQSKYLTDLDKYSLYSEISITKRKQF